MTTFDEQGWLDVSDDIPRRAYMATAGQTVFQFPFVFYAEGDLTVTVNGVTQTLSTDYVTSGALEEAEEDGVPVPKSVTFTGALVGGESVIIAMELPYELTTHIPPSGPLDISAINLQFSKFVSMLQQIDADRVRSLHQSSADAEDLDDLPDAEDRANSYLAFDADGQPIAAADPTAYPASSFMATVLDDTTAIAARATLGITDQSAYSGLSNYYFCR